jgi:hypothetical protein
MTPEQLLRPTRSALVALREGVASEQQWHTLAGAVETALAIDRRGVVRGMRGHLLLGEQALAGITLRAMDGGTWCPTPLYLQEIDDVTEALRMHEYQLQQLGHSEFCRVVVRAEAEIRSAGGQVLDVGKLQGVLA